MIACSWKYVFKVGVSMSLDLKRLNSIFSNWCMLSGMSSF